MSSRSSGSAIVFLILLLGIGFYAAYQARQSAPAPEPETASVGDDADTSKAASIGDKASTESDAAAPASAPTPQETAKATGAGDGVVDAQSDGKAPAAEPAAAGGSDPSAETTSAEQPTETASGVGAGRTDTSAPEAATRGDETTTTMELQTPSYDIVRVEPSGDAVIAGRASPGATIVLEANGKVIGQTTANAGGEWVIVLEEPLKPGDYDIAVRASREATKEEKASLERLAVSIPQNGNETPLVAVTRPDAPDTVIQKPEPGGTQVTAATDAQTGAAGNTQATSPMPAGSTDTWASSATSSTGQAAGANTAAGSGASTGAEETVIGTLKVREETVSEPTAPDTAEAAGTQPTAASGETSEAAVAATGSQKPAKSTAGAGDAAAGAAPSDETSEPAPTGGASAEGDPDTASVASAPATSAAAAPAEQPVSLPITIESAEADAGTFRVRGTSEPGTDVWLYLDGEFMGEANTGADGQWQFESSMAFEAGESSIRADQIDDPKGSVAARAEAPFGFRAKKEQTVAAADSQDDASTQAAAPTKAASQNTEAPEVEVVGETDEGVRVLIRRGDDLWTIARHFYGDGFSYTSIYQANGGQIRDPPIYPGQVFTLPGLTKKDVTGEAQKRAL